jgi:DNA-directed RNA polymerase specialized sigma24 family protein
VGNRLNAQDISSRYCQRRKGVTVERLDQFDEEENAWREAVVEDTRSAPVPETVAFRMDFADWLHRMPKRNRQIVEFLAIGNRTGEAARKFGVSEGRVSQLRRELDESWRAFTGESPLAGMASAVV